MSDNIRKKYRKLYRIVEEFLSYAFKYAEKKEMFEHMSNSKKSLDDLIIKNEDDYVEYLNAREDYIQRKNDLLSTIKRYQNAIQDLAKSFQIIESDSITIVYIDKDNNREYEVSIITAIKKRYPIWKIVFNHNNTMQYMYIYAFDKDDAEKDFGFTLSNLPQEGIWES